MATNTTLFFSTNSATLVGGNGGNVYFATNNTFSYGGSGLNALESELIISNGTFVGGNSGDALVDTGYYSESIGGNGIFATNSTLTILDGTFTGGNAGEATTNLGGPGIFSIDSDITVEGGEFTGGISGDNTSWGLLSRATSNETTTITLNGGTFNLLGFDGEGTQYLTTDTNLVVQKGVIQYEGTLVVTNLTDTPFQTSTVFDGTMRFVNNFTLEDGGELYIASPEGRIDFTNSSLSIATDATVWFMATSNGTGSVTADDVYLHNGSAITIVNQIMGLPVDTSITSSVITASSSFNIVDSAGITNSTPSLETVKTNINFNASLKTRTGLTDIFLPGGNTLALEFTTKSLSNYWDATGQFAVLANELDALTNLNSELLSTVDIIADPDISGPLVEQTYFTIPNTFQTSMQGLQAAVGQSAARGAEFRAQLSLIPPGARGPERNNDLRGWGKYYAQYLTHDKQDLSTAYETTLHGGVIGIDQSFGDLLLGISGGSGRYSTTYDNNAEEDITATHGAIFGTYGADHLYIDAGVAYGQNEVETQTAAPFTLLGEFDSTLLSAYIGAGYDFIDEKGGTAFTPEISIRHTSYSQDAYSETGTNAIPRNMDAFDADSLQSSLGLNLSTLSTTVTDQSFGFRMDVRFHWLHEFNPEPGTMRFNLEGGSHSHALTYPALDEDLFRLGLGFSFFNSARNKPKNVMLRVDLDELFGADFNSHNLSAKVIYAF